MRSVEPSRAGPAFPLCTVVPLRWPTGGRSERRQLAVGSASVDQPTLTGFCRMQGAVCFSCTQAQSSH